MANKGDRVRVGLAGAGAITQVVHLPILAERDDVEVVAVADIDDLKANTIGGRFGIERIVDDEALCSAEDIDGVLICAPSYRHQDLAVSALAAGKHVLVERPLSLSAAGARAVVEAATQSEGSVVMGLAHRFRPDVSALRAFIAGGELGELSAVQASWLNRKVRQVRTTWRQLAEQAGGGALMDLGVQALDLVLWLLGYPSVRTVRARLYGDEFEVEEEAHLDAETEDGVTISLAASWRFHGAADIHSVRVLGSEGGATLPPLSVYKQLGGRPLDVTPRQPIPRGGEDLFTNAYRRQIDHFIRVMAGEAEAALPEGQIALMGLIESAYRSAEEGREVQLS
ncbi:MAG: Gfo/Idh/MocA family oxidoreductase [Gemmatimonadetes bacterium]|nr:Gfo/Idh/MocA family oxidoreductase [Gemmatimonadota bacterium]